jgi:hypothetical protein
MDGGRDNHNVHNILFRYFHDPSYVNHSKSLLTREYYHVFITSNISVKGIVRRLEGRAIAQAVSRRPPTAEARVRSRVSPCGICGGQSDTGRGFSPEYFGFPQSISFHRCSITRKRTNIIIIFIFIIGLHNKPHGCGASVASAAGPFATKNKKTNGSENRGINGGRGEGER